MFSDPEEQLQSLIQGLDEHFVDNMHDLAIVVHRWKDDLIIFMGEKVFKHIIVDWFDVILHQLVILLDFLWNFKTVQQGYGSKTVGKFVNLLDKNGSLKKIG